MRLWQVLVFTFRRFGFARRTTLQEFLEQFQRLYDLGWRICDPPSAFPGGLRLRSPDSADHFVYCPLQAVAHEFRGLKISRRFIEDPTWFPLDAVATLGLHNDVGRVIVQYADTAVSKLRVHKSWLADQMLAAMRVE